ncbi:MAG: glycine cleavage system protein R [Actinomycetota bacterium]
MPHYAITAIGEDRPGIVAAITEALFEIGGNLEDVSSTVLRGHFAMMFVVGLPEGTEAAQVEERVGAAAEPLGVSVSVSDVEAGAADRPVATHVLVVYGADHPGIVAGLARALADRDVNISDLSCRLVDSERPVYTMTAEVAVPESADPDKLEAELTGMSEQLGVDVTFRPIEVETL